ncbi:hypothetical protein DAI22_10g054475 [Oryza sativa Japonica Group]|nr:hypothetical protein DAI22_10g054475 [Oryza sativa Japonica Group]
MRVTIEILTLESTTATPCSAVRLSPIPPSSRCLRPSTPPSPSSPMSFLPSLRPVPPRPPQAPPSILCHCCPWKSTFVPCPFLIRHHLSFVIKGVISPESSKLSYSYPRNKQPQRPSPVHAATPAFGL